MSCFRERKFLCYSTFHSIRSRAWSCWAWSPPGEREFTYLILGMRCIDVRCFFTLDIEERRSASSRWRSCWNFCTRCARSGVDFIRHSTHDLFSSLDSDCLFVNSLRLTVNALSFSLEKEKKFECQLRKCKAQICKQGHDRFSKVAIHFSCFSTFSYIQESNPVCYQTQFFLNVNFLAFCSKMLCFLMF